MSCVIVATARLKGARGVSGGKVGQELQPLWFLNTASLIEWSVRVPDLSWARVSRARDCRIFGRLPGCLAAGGRVEPWYPGHMNRAVGGRKEVEYR